MNDPRICPPQRELSEEQVTREVLRIIAALGARGLILRSGELVIPEGLPDELLTRIRCFEPELRWAAGMPTPPGERWGRA